MNQVIQVNQVKGEKKEKSLVSGEDREGEEKKLPADGGVDQSKVVHEVRPRGPNKEYRYKKIYRLF